MCTMEASSLHTLPVSNHAQSSKENMAGPNETIHQLITSSVVGRDQLGSWSDATALVGYAMTTTMNYNQLN